MAFVTRHVFTMAVFGSLVSAVLAQSSENWVSRYDGGHWDAGACCAVDGNGNSYVAIASEGSSTGTDIVLAKYSPVGDQLWVRTYDQAGGYDAPVKVLLALDGSVYVLGDAYGGTTTDQDIVILKYASDGTKLWSQLLDSGANLGDKAHDAVLDSIGNVYFSGKSEVTGVFALSEFVTGRVNSDGTVGWKSTYRTSTNKDFDSFCMSYFKAGNTDEVFVVGTRDEQGVILLYQNGALSNVTNVVGSDSNHRTVLNRIIGLPNGDVVTIGNAQFAKKWQVILSRYQVIGTQLNQIWTTSYSIGSATDPPDYATHAAVDPAGNIIVAGWAMQPQGDRDYMILKFAPTGGAPLWAATFGESPGSAEELSDLAVDPISGAIYVTGRSKAAATADDYTTIKYDTNGVRQWVERFHGNDNRPLDDAAAIALDPLGGATVTGGSYSANNDWDAVTVHYDDGTTVKPSAFQVTVGVLGSGALSDLLDSDDHYVTVKYNTAFPNPFNGDQILVTGSTTPGPINELRFGIESHVVGVSVAEKIELRDYQAGNWVTVDTRPAQQSDVLVIGSGSNPSRFVDASGQVQAKISYTIVGPRVGVGLDVLIDRAVWRIVR